MGKHIYRSIKRGFVSGVRSVLSIELNPPKRKADYLHRTTSQAIRDHWEDVGYFIGDAMHQVDRDTFQKGAEADFQRNDAHQVKNSDERKKQRFERAAG